ncbi:MULTISPECIES: DUF4142 domain-containing protein [unclassified Streptomyces]|uniref:DUF4142 domain-containing protein n=1 Tax=unclassified Streptomyces TaxID=2593676 RepID=UPI00382DF760
MFPNRFTAGTALVAGALVCTAAALVYPAMSGVNAAASSPYAGAVSTPYGPMTALDREFVVKVRLAGLWEFPAGQIALQKGTTQAVKTAGQHLIDGHTALDSADRTVATQLGIVLPNQPTPQQQGFLATLSGANGTAFDSTFANLLRLTHGQIFNTIAKVRSTTMNSLVRQLADQANNTVLDHITVMEKTGLVNFPQVVDQTTASPTINPADTVAPSPAPGEPTLIVNPQGSGSLAPAVSAPPQQ